MDPENIEICIFMEDILEESLITNFGVTYEARTERGSNARKRSSFNTVSAINDIVGCFLVKYKEHILDIIHTLLIYGKRDIYVALLGQFYLVESGFSWSKVRKFLGIICAVATYCYIKGMKRVRVDILNNTVSFLCCKLFYNPEKFIGCQAFEQNCTDYVSQQQSMRIMGDIKHLRDLEQELNNMLPEYTYVTGMSGILRPGQIDAASSSQASSDPNAACIQVHCSVFIKSSKQHASNQTAPSTLRNDASEQSTVNIYEPVAEPSSVKNVHNPQLSINNPVSSGSAGNMTCNQEPSGLNNTSIDSKEALIERFIFFEVFELEYLVTLSLKIINLIKNVEGTYHVRYN